MGPLIAAYPPPTQSQQRGPHRRSGGDTVVDHDHGPACDFRRWPVPPVGEFPPFQLPAFPKCHGLERIALDVQGVDNLIVEYPHAARGERPHGQFFLTRHPEFADEHHIQWRLQKSGDLVSDRHSATRQGKHEHIGPAAIAREFLGQRLPRFSSIVKSRWHGEIHGAGPVQSASRRGLTSW